MTTPARRSVLTGLAGAAAGTVIALSVPDRPAYAAPLGTDPFTLGVASGDPLPDSVVLWTRLARAPLADDGLGGMPHRPVAVEWEIAEDEHFARPARRGLAVASPTWAHSLHVEVGGLKPDRWYWYRFRAEGHVSRTGRTRTAPEPHRTPPKLTLAYSTCARFDHGWFTAYTHLADEDPDLIVQLGDYIYEYPTGTGAARPVTGPECLDLAGYRRRYAEFHLDPALAAAHAAAPWSAVWDDHEVENNWAGLVPEDGSATPAGPAFTARRIAAARAYYENLPFRSASVPRGIGMQVYRRLHWGTLATFHLLDTRQFRDDQACGDGYKSCPEASDPARTITGAAQERWLLDGFRRSTARWDVITQQVFFAQRDNTAGPVKMTSMDAWDGYTASRDRITRGWVDAGVRNPVVLTGDVHANWASELKLDYDDPTSRSVGTEFVATSVTSGGDGFDADSHLHPFLAINPHLKFYNNQRGYLRSTLTPQEMHTDYRVVPTVSAPVSEVRTRASFTVEDRVPLLNQTYDRPLDPGTDPDPWPLAARLEPLPQDIPATTAELQRLRSVPRLTGR